MWITVGFTDTPSCGIQFGLASDGSGWSIPFFYCYGVVFGANMEFLSKRVGVGEVSIGTETYGLVVWVS